MHAGSARSLAARCWRRPSEVARAPARTPACSATSFRARADRWTRPALAAPGADRAGGAGRGQGDGWCRPCFAARSPTATLEVAGDGRARSRWSQASRPHRRARARVGDARTWPGPTQAGQLDELEDNLFRFGRHRRRERRAARRAVSDRRARRGQAARCSTTCSAGRSTSRPRRLLGQAVASAGTASLTVDWRLPAGRRRPARQRWSPRCGSAAPLSEDAPGPAGRRALAAVRPAVHLNVIVDPDVLGGVRVARGRRGHRLHDREPAQAGATRSSAAASGPTASPHRRPT